MIKRSIYTLLGIFLTTAPIALAAGGAVAAPAQQLIKSASVPVCESQTDVDALTDLLPGDRLVIQASGTIWAGFWFIGDNGPQGLWFVGGSDYPLSNSPADGLLMRAGSGYRFVGTGGNLISTDPPGRVYFRINDNVTGNGKGCFTVNYQQYR
jgi:hypothetical protein